LHHSAHTPESGPSLKDSASIEANPGGGKGCKVTLQNVLYVTLLISVCDAIFVTFNMLWHFRIIWHSAVCEWQGTATFPKTCLQERQPLFTSYGNAETLPLELSREKLCLGKFASQRVLLPGYLYRRWPQGTEATI
jgi:hypothetical protein